MRRVGEVWAVAVPDRGSGLTETVMANALVPFYSTKRSDTGLGLALLERDRRGAYGGRIALNTASAAGCRSRFFPTCGSFDRPTTRQNLCPLWVLPLTKGRDLQE